MRRTSLALLVLLGCEGDPSTRAVDPAGIDAARAAPAAAVGPLALGDDDYVLFEAGPVRPLALTPSGARLVVANVPDDRIEVFLVGPRGALTFEKSIAVGLRPVAVAARTDSEVWVVNHLSDSVSVVDLDVGAVTRTVLVGDEPRDVVFAGPGGDRAFVTTAHRGQHRTDPSLSTVPGAGNPQLTTAGVDRADVWVFDANALGNTIGGRPLRVVTLFGDTPRGLAVSPDGRTVYAAIFHSGNQTTVVAEQRVCNGFQAAGVCAGDGIRSPGGLPRGRLPGGLPGPSANVEGLRAPETALIVQWDPADARWEDALGRNWSNGVRFNLPDRDLFAIDATTLAVSTRATGVGTTIFNVATNPVSGRIYATNTEAQNLVRFEGDGDLGGTSVQGDLARSRITIVNPGNGAVTRVDLNRHLDRRVRPAPPGDEDHSLSTPLDLAVSADGRTLYVAALGSGVVGVIPTAALEAGTFDPRVASAGYVPVTGGGPAGLALDDARGVLFVYTRFDDGVSVVDTSTGAEVDHLLLHSPEPDYVVDGRPVLYDARATSSNGEASCASCHIFGDLDQLAWDLGNPSGEVTRRQGVVHLEAGGTAGVNGTGVVRDMHPMKGPMLTQTLRGISTHGPLHWRGDRAVGLLGSDPLDERVSFLNFVVAFQDLLGDDVPPTDPDRLAQIEALADFSLALFMPPNPVRALDNSLTASQARGLDLFDGPRRMVGRPQQFDQPGLPAGFTCQECHRLDPATGFFGADGAASLDPIRQVVKVPQFRNLYTRVGMFGQPNIPFLLPGDGRFRGNQIRGFGFMHDGSIDTLFRLFTADSFAPSAQVGFQSDQQRRDMEQFLLAFPSDLAPVVGQQVTVHPTSVAAARDRARLLMARAGAPFASTGGTITECDLVVHFASGGRQVGMLFDPSTQRFQPDASGAPTLDLTAIGALIVNQQTPATFTCVPPGTGFRAALDRDRDGILDGDEFAAGSDPADPSEAFAAPPPPEMDTF